MSERGHYGEARRNPASYLTDGAGHLTIPDLPQDFAPIGVALGIGTLIGVLIGTKLTFHLPVRRRR